LLCGWGQFEMSPKKMLTVKYTRDQLEKLERPEIQELGRVDRKAGHAIGSLNRSTVDIIKDLMKVKIQKFQGQGSVSEKAADADEDLTGMEVDDEMAQLEARMHVLKAQKKASAVEKSTSGQQPHKLIPPSKLSEPVSSSSYKVWVREYSQWKALYVGTYSEAALLQSALLALSTVTKEAVFAECPAGTLTLSRVEQALEDMHAGDVLLDQRRALSDVRALRRGRDSLSDFLRKWKHVRATARVAGVLPSGSCDSDAWDLLECAELTNSQKGSLLAEMQTRRDLLEATQGTPFDATECMLKLLRNLALAFEASEQQREAKKVTTRQDEKMALYASAPADLKGAKGDWPHWAFPKGATKGKGKSAKVECWTCGKSGHMSPECWHKSGSKGKSGAKGAKKGKSGAKGGKKGKGKDEGPKCWKCGQLGHRQDECEAKGGDGAVKREE
jgi:hypothetical protein